MSTSRTCCVCGRELPNRFAIAGQCREPGCEAVFCHLHWSRGDGLCPRHGGSSGGPVYPEKTPVEEPLRIAPGTVGVQEDHSADAPETVGGDKETSRAVAGWAALTAKQAKRVMAKTLSFAKKAGGAAATLLGRLRKDRSPEAMLDTLEASMEANKSRRARVSAEQSALYDEILALKKRFETAPAARKRTLERELRRLMSEYKDKDAEIALLLENETIISKVRGHLHQLMVYELRGVDEDQVDLLTDVLEEQVDAQEGLLDAVADQERAARRKDRHGDEEDFLGQLAEFGIDEAAPTRESEADDSAGQSWERTPEITDDDEGVDTSPGQKTKKEPE